ncbi:hypothetical protein FE257_007359 [Aspergillus nanangensis]|uniref:Uncharacterized protein n=1 Tax=Aspergillus nanangensis TaxID=2582783 RepID=A0AAD4CPQ0_ASPNN|nr:hypothetical protein FE257_007359 [Aspergillus nanangensis]
MKGLIFFVTSLAISSGVSAAPESETAAMKYQIPWDWCGPSVRCDIVSECQEGADCQNKAANLLDTDS